MHLFDDIHKRLVFTDIYVYVFPMHVKVFFNLICHLDFSTQHTHVHIIQKHLAVCNKVDLLAKVIHKICFPLKSLYMPCSSRQFFITNTPMTSWRIIYLFTNVTQTWCYQSVLLWITFYVFVCMLVLKIITSNTLNR